MAVSKTKFSEIRSLIIGGSGAYNMDRNKFGNEIDSFRLKTPYGYSNPVHIYKNADLTFGLISRHGEKRYSTSAGFVNYRANIYAAKSLGVQRILAWSGPGAISKKLKPGTYFLPDDILDFTKNRPHTFYEKEGLGFIRENPVFCPELAGTAVKVLRKTGSPYRAGGVYVCTEGPRLETPAEIRAFRTLGGDAVGMTLVPEVFLARELEICYLAVCYISNYAEGVKQLKFRKGELFEGTLPSHLKQKVTQAVERLPEILLSVMKKTANMPRKCACSCSMLRYRKEGCIGEDWRKWFG